MSNAAWPASLPAYVEAGGFSETAEPVTVRSEVSVGPPKLRPRYTAEVRRLEASLFLTTAQAATLQTFYTDTLVFGSLPFDWVDPRTQAATTFRFVARPTLISAGGLNWRARLSLEVLP